MLHYASLEQWSLGVNTVDTAITTPAGGFVMEMLLTMLLVLVVFPVRPVPLVLLAPLVLRVLMVLLVLLMMLRWPF